MDSPLNTNEEAVTLQEVVCSFVFIRDTVHEEVAEQGEKVMVLCSLISYSHFKFRTWLLNFETGMQQNRWFKAKLHSLAEFSLIQTGCFQIRLRWLG